MGLGNDFPQNNSGLITTGGAPTASVGPSSGSTATVSILSGTDQRFELQIVSSGTGIATGIWAYVDFGGTWPSVPYAVLTPSNFTNATACWTFYIDHSQSTTTRLAIGNNFNSGAGTFKLMVFCLA